ncbi:hypothetical protein RI845_10615 [Thalassotalea nanhaiensis]|uniref:Aminoacylase n=1 Tax=Thalassotalea nanhaiensis TaxID=3065648 RepID=A0ABY9TDR1_9GAMM|nr:hypothetical protein RI845_10615 [Colwelliaceae bacterium SQ345]
MTIAPKFQLTSFVKVSVLALLSLAIAACSSTDGGNAPESYDIVINNGRVIDPETKFDGIRNVGVKDGRIVTITEDAITGNDTIDATGFVVSPGFIDTHTHSSVKYNIKMAMMDGVTTAMDYELGGMNIGAWYDQEMGQWPINYGTCVSHEQARMMVLDKLNLTEPIDAKDAFTLRAKSKEDGMESWSVQVSTKAELENITKILDENLRQGALCIGTTVGYAAVGISSYELFEVQRTAARYGRPIGSHTRYHGTNKPPQEATLGADEVILNAMILDAPLVYSHNNDWGWWEIEEKLSIAREKGYNMWAEYYPYEAVSTAIGAAPLAPEIFINVLGYSYEDAMYDPTQSKFLSQAEYEDVLAKDPGRTVIVYNRMRTEWMPDWLTLENVTIGSDAMWSNNPEDNWDTDPAKYAGHPRTSGSHTTILRLGREHKVSLTQSISQLSYWPAKFLGKTGLTFFDERGRIQEGMVADIVIFDPKTVKEGSSYDVGQNGLPPIGLPHVIVNGKFVKRDNQAIKEMAGLPVRYPVEETGRWQPVKAKQIK